MFRKCFSFPLDEFPDIRKCILAQANRETHFCFLDSNGHRDGYSRFDWITAWGAEEEITPPSQSFAALKAFRAQRPDWLFGHLSYSLKNQVEALSNKHRSEHPYAPLSFFVPKVVLYVSGSEVRVESLYPLTKEELFTQLQSVQLSDETPISSVQFTSATSRQAYLNKVNHLKQALQYGNIYEINYCLSFDAHCKLEEPAVLFERLNENTKAPFAALYKRNTLHLMCASPERYLQKNGSKLIVQPIKGTAPRDSNAEADTRLKQALYNSEKERAENVMIVDLMRNDLSRTAKKGSVKVEELFGIYSFETVHQMISTVSSELDERYTLEDVLETSFPMGSMTGAPKLSAMQLIDAHEAFSRDLYSGAVGYITPQGDCDFNVVIRAFLYNGATHKLSVRVGSAITILAEAEAEYEECLLKAEKLFASLS